MGFIGCNKSHNSSSVTDELKIQVQSPLLSRLLLQLLHVCSSCGEIAPTVASSLVHRRDWTLTSSACSLRNVVIA